MRKTKVKNLKLLKNFKLYVLTLRFSLYTLRF